MLINKPPLLRIFQTFSKWQGRESPKKHFNRSIKFYRQFIPPGALCFDVGANIGNRVGPLLKIGAAVVAVEPQEQCCQQLQNLYGSKIEIVNKGAGAKEEIKTFHVSDTSTISTFSEDWMTKSRFKDFTWKETHQIELTTLDKLIMTYGVPHFLKIDVEGYELEVLKGLNVPVKFISFEYAVPEQTDNLIKCIKRLTEINPAFEFNYSVGESMEWSLSNWINPEEMIALIQQTTFQATSFGDIYARLKD